MPRRVVNESAEDRAVREVDAEDGAAIDSLALQAGPPADSNRMSLADEDAAWEKMDPQVDHEQMATALLTQGLPPEQAQQLLAVKLHPEWLPLYLQPTQDAEQADMLVKLARHPFRLSLLEGIDDPDERVRKAESLDRRYQKKMAEHLDQPIVTTGYGRALPEQGD